MNTELAISSLLLLLLAAVTGVVSTGVKAPSPSSSPPPPPQKSTPPPPRKSAPPPPRKAAHSRPRSPPAARANCSYELMAFSKCLPYISSSRNNATNSPSSQCCNDVASAFTSGSAVCLCYLVQKPGFLGFPLNSTKILSLTSLCPMRIHGTKANFSLSSLCSRRRSLPPLKSITSPTQTKPRISGDLRNGPESPPPPPAVNLTQKSGADSDTPAPADDLPSVPKYQNISQVWPFIINGINNSRANLAGFSLSSWLLMLLFMF